MIRTRLRNRGGNAKYNPPIDVLTLEAPVSSGISTKALYAFGFDRMVDGYVGNTVRLIRVSDSVQADFGFDSLGRFDMAAVDAWRGASDVNVVKFYDQKVTGKELTSTGTISLVSGGAVKRFGTTWSNSDGQLTRSATNGGVGADTGNGLGALYTGALTINQSTESCEIHMLLSPNQRKCRDAYVAGDTFGANSTTERWFWYGSNANNFIRWQVGSSWKDYFSFFCGSSNDASNSAQDFHKKYSQEVYSFELNPTDYRIHAEGKVYGSATYTGTNATAVPAGALNNGGLMIGGWYGTSLTNVSATSRGDFIFGGVIVTKALTDLERFMLRSKLSAVGQQHRIKTRTDLLSYFDEYILFKNASGSSVSGSKGKVSLNINTSVVAEGTPDWVYNYAQAGLGITGLRAPTVNQANSFKAASNYFAGTTTGSIISMHYSESSGNNLPKVIAQGVGTGRASPDISLSLGFDHAECSMMAMLAPSRDTQGLMGTRRKADETTFGANPYDGANQSQGKYNRNTSHSKFTFGETISGVVWNASEWLGVGSQPYLLDAPVVPHTKDNIKYVQKDGALLLQIGTFKAPAGYNRADSYTTRKPLRLQSNNWSYVSNGSPIGHRDGDIANNPYGGVVDSDDNATIQTTNENTTNQPSFCGTRYFAGFCTTELTAAQVEEIQVNLYKLL